MRTLSDLIARHRPESPAIGEFPRAVGERLRRQRIAFAWRQADLAQRAGVSVQTVKALEKGEAISYESLLRLLLAFGHGSDFLKMLDAPNFPDLAAHERFMALRHSHTRGAPATRVRRKAPESP